MSRERKDLKRLSNCRDLKPCTAKTKVKGFAELFKNLFKRENTANEKIQDIMH
jgi:hypothetical protein